MIKPLEPKLFSEGLLFKLDLFFLRKREAIQTKHLNNFAQWVSNLDMQFIPMGIIYGIVLYYLNSWIDLLQFILLVTLSDQICKQLIKNRFNRYRPCWQIRQENNPLRADYGLFNEFSGYTKHARSSMCSSHAANFLAQALLINLLAPEVSIYIFPLFIIVGISRWYVGAHWVSDIIVGWGVGYLAFWLHTNYVYPFIISFF